MNELSKQASLQIIRIIKAENWTGCGHGDMANAPVKLSLNRNTEV